MTLVSVVIPAYNQARYLTEALQSVMIQTLGDLEIILVDDGSTDQTAQIVKGISDPRLRYIYQDNRGLSAARNTGMRSSSGEYLTFLDSDDLFLPSKLELLVRAMESHPEAGIAAGQAIPIDDQGNRIGKVFTKRLPDYPAELLLGNPLHVGSVLLRRSWQQKVGYFDENLRSYEDWDMWLRLALAGCRAVWVPEPVSLYRFHGAQMTRLGSQMTEATFAVLDKFFAQPDLPQAWASRKDEAYSRAHLRAAAQAYVAQDFELAGSHLRHAVRLNPVLMENDASPLAHVFRAWTDLPKTRDPLAFLKSVYLHLPAELEALARLRTSHLGRAAADFALESFERQDYARTRRYALKAFKYRPALLLNRGIVSILVRSFLDDTESRRPHVQQREGVQSEACTPHESP
ncbi:MAG: glycosyltransferase [Acidobacteria bacterium]|nr:glycosyltransferase [Acidobacteriota bacterium]